MPLYLATETTGLSPANGDRIIELAIVDSDGNSLIDTLLDPGRKISSRATKLHGITDEMVRGKPTIAQALPMVVDLICGQEVVIYNRDFKIPFFPGRLVEAAVIRCAMMDLAEHLDGKWRSLDAAAMHVGHIWTGSAHRALTDALACRSVWQWAKKQR
jgi:DNA polymerase III epsilon subunit-like protein